MAVIETQGFKLDNSGKRVVVDPITRIEGHLRIEVNLDDKNVIRAEIARPTPDRLLKVAQAMRLGLSHDEIHAYCKIDPWFLAQFAELVELRGDGGVGHGQPFVAVARA